jgi:hypothetical protein
MSVLHNKYYINYYIDIIKNHYEENIDFDKYTKIYDDFFEIYQNQNIEFFDNMVSAWIKDFETEKYDIGPYFSVEVAKFRGIENKPIIDLYEDLFIESAFRDIIIKKLGEKKELQKYSKINYELNTYLAGK